MDLINEIIKIHKNNNVLSLIKSELDSAVSNNYIGMDLSDTCSITTISFIAPTGRIKQLDSSNLISIEYNTRRDS